MMWVAWIIAGIVAVCVMTAKEGNYGCITVVIGTIIVWGGMAVLALISTLITDDVLQLLFRIGVVVGICLIAKLYARYRTGKKRLKKHRKGRDE